MDDDDIIMMTMRHKKSNIKRKVHNSKKCLIFGHVSHLNVIYMASRMPTYINFHWKHRRQQAI